MKTFENFIDEAEEYISPEMRRRNIARTAYDKNPLPTFGQAICTICGREFTRMNEAEVTCSLGCRDEGRRRSKKKWKDTEIELVCRSCYSTYLITNEKNQYNKTVGKEFLCVSCIEKAKKKRAQKRIPETTDPQWQIIHRMNSVTTPDRLIFVGSEGNARIEFEKYYTKRFSGKIELYNDKKKFIKRITS